MQYFTQFGLNQKRQLRCTATWGRQLFWNSNHKTHSVPSCLISAKSNSARLHYISQYDLTILNT